MAMTFLSQASSKFENEFIVNALIPATIFVPLCAAAVIEPVWGITNVLVTYTSWAPSWQIAAAIAVLAVIWFFAYIIAGSWTLIVQLFEGYYLRRIWNWITWSSYPAPPVPGMMAQLQRLIKMEDKKGELPDYDWELDLNFEISSQPRILPTCLGNILNAAEM